MFQALGLPSEYLSTQKPPKAVMWYKIQKKDKKMM